MRDAHPIITYRTLTLVWVVLLVLTAITVLVTHLDVGGYRVLVALLVASLKSALVIAIFMHMRHESWLLRGLLMVALIAVAVNIGLTFFDVLYR